MTNTYLLAWSSFYQLMKLNKIRINGKNYNKNSLIEDYLKKNLSLLLEKKEIIENSFIMDQKRNQRVPRTRSNGRLKVMRGYIIM